MQQVADKMNFQDPVQKYAECHSWDMSNSNAYLSVSGRRAIFTPRLIDFSAWFWQENLGPGAREFLYFVAWSLWED